MTKLIPIILILLGLAAGTGAGFMLRPAPLADDTAEPSVAELPGPDRSNLAVHDIRNQFMVPLMSGERISAVLVMSLSIEVSAAHLPQVAQSEPRLRDRFLQVLFDHANTGGFEGMFTANNKMDLLRQSLLEAAQDVLGREAVQGILITDILRSAT